MRAIRPLEHVIRDMSERVLAISERISDERTAVDEVARELRDVTAAVRLMRDDLRAHQEGEEREFDAIAKRFEALERRMQNGTGVDT